jgi:hypothetical protein
MILLILEIGMFVWGMIALCTGRLQWSANKPIRGIGARVGGFIMLLPMPVAFGVGVLLRIYHESHGIPIGDQVRLFAGIIELGICLVFLLMAGLISHAVGSSKRRRRRRDAEDSEEYEYDRRPRRYEEDDYDRDRRRDRYERRRNQEEDDNGSLQRWNRN